MSLVVRHFLYLNLSSFTVGFGHIICRICHTTTHDLDCAAEYTKSGVKKKKQNYEVFIAYLEINSLLKCIMVTEQCTCYKCMAQNFTN